MSNGDWSFHVQNQLTRNDHPQYQRTASNPTSLVTSLTAGSDLVVSGGDGLGHGDLTVALSEDTAWTTATILNAWTAGSVAPAFRKIGSLVAIRGFATGGVLATAVFQLPVGYRPSTELRFATTANAAFADFRILATGQVQPNVGSTTNVFLNCVFSLL